MEKIKVEGKEIEVKDKYKIIKDEEEEGEEVKSLCLKERI